MYVYNFTLSIGGSDYTAVSTSITVNPFQPTPSITINIIDDQNFENDETFFVNFTGCSPGCVVPTDSDTVTVTIQSDEGNYILYSQL